MGAIQDNVSMLVAGLDLALVQSVITAIRTADQSQPPHATSTPASRPVAPPAAIAPVSHAHRGSRNSDYPAATFNSHAAPQKHREVIEQVPCICNRPVDAAGHHESTIQPPWKVLPWPTTVRQKLAHYHQQVKILPNRDDVTVAGRLLDVFV